MGENAACSSTLAGVAHPLTSGWSGVGEGASAWCSAGAASGLDLQSRVPRDTAMSCLLDGTGGCPAVT